MKTAPITQELLDDALTHQPNSASTLRSFNMLSRSILPLLLLAAAGSSRADTKPVSYYQDLLPVFKRSCQGCHSPGKVKGELDLTTIEAMKKGGKTGPAIQPGQPEKSLLIEQISGDPPEMPKKGDPLSKDEIALIARWIREGAIDDTPEDKKNPYKLKGPPVYASAPVISALAYSPDGQWLAISGYHEVLLHHADGSGLAARCVGESPRIESIAFSKDGKLLAVSGGAPSVFGEIQVWNAESHQLEHAYKYSSDSLYGASFSPDGQKIAFGGADKIARIVAVQDGKELLHFDNHSDWVFATTFTVDGQRLLTGSRDRAMKMINASNGQFIDDINKLLEAVFCMARNPKEDQVAYGGDLAIPRVYKISDNQGRTAANNDVNLVREFERQPGPIYAIAYSPDGAQIAVGGVSPEVRIYKVSDGSRVATLKGQEGATFAVEFNPKKNEIAAGGYDGKLRIFELPSGKLLKEFIPVPLKAPETKIAAASAK